MCKMNTPRSRLGASLMFLVGIFPRTATSFSKMKVPKASVVRLRTSSITTSDVPDSFSKGLVDVGRAKLADYFSFPLDDWQLKAGGAICEGYNVIVCAPTGAGKTVVGEMALLHAYNGGSSGIYTTPLKALSNQKYSELCSMFSREDTGLSTGDVSVNKGAKVTVMTTEVYRNIAWRSSTPMATAMGTNELENNGVVVLDEFHYMGLPGRGGVWEECIITSPSHTQIVGLSATLSNAQALTAWLEHVTARKTILVEVPGQKRPVPLRYLFALKDGLYPLFRDPNAGPGAPNGLLGFRDDGQTNATNSNKDFTVDRENPSPRVKLPRGLQVNPALRASAKKRIQKVNRVLERQRARKVMRMDDEGDDYWKPKRKPPGKMSPKEEQKQRERLLKNEMRRAVPSLPAILNRLKQKELLPAIFFIFSRAGCDNAARGVYQYMKGPEDPTKRPQSELEEFGMVEKRRDGSRKGKARFRGGGDVVQDADGRSFRKGSNYLSEETLDMMEHNAPLADDEFDDATPLSPKNWDFYSKAGLLSYGEIRDVASRLTRFNSENPQIAFDDEEIEQYLFGCGSHHAGMLPAHKSFVEILFRRQLMKVVFATETLAAGINMPARTTVVCALAKRSDSSAMSLLETSNLLQIAGRAGRRGMDTDGTCVIVATPFESHDEASQILTDPIKPIKSQFSPSYSLAINLVARGEGKLDVAKTLISNSFAMWEKRKAEHQLISAINGSSESSVFEVLKASAQERFMNHIVDTFQSQVDRRSAAFDVARLERLLKVLTDRESLKKASKSFIGGSKILEQEEATLEYLETELEAFRSQPVQEDRETAILSKILAEDQDALFAQVSAQRERVSIKERDLSKHPFSAISAVVNSILENESPESRVLASALNGARALESVATESLGAEELSEFAKSAVVVRRKTRKFQTANPGVDAESLLRKQMEEAEEQTDSWQDMLGITKTLVAYGCLVPKNEDANVSLEDQEFDVTPAGLNIGMVGFDNSLWALVAMGGASDVIGASSELDKFRSAMSSFRDGDDMDSYDDEDKVDVEAPDTVIESRREAMQLTEMLRAMDPSEFAGYVACIVSENSRRNSGPVLEQFQNLTPMQQRVIQSALTSMERLTEIQKQCNVDKKTSSCSLSIDNAEVVTAWASGCTWPRALEISGSPPGDLARTLSRVLDALRQYGNLPFVPMRRNSELLSSQGLDGQVRQLCRDAARLINRYPVKDPLQFQELKDEGVEIEDDEVFGDDGEESDGAGNDEESDFVDEPL